MFWYTLSRAFNRRQSSSSKSASGQPPKKPPDPKPGKKEDCKVKIRTQCNAAAFCAPADRFHSMWDPPANLPPPYPFIVPRSNEFCCGPNCTKPLPSFDEMYYHPSCKDGPYQRHWVECPKFMMRVKKVCAYEKLEALEPARRSTPRREHVNGRSDLSGPCPHLAPLARCRPGRNPPRCFKAKTPSCCRKICAPFPCWSECKQPPLAKRRLRPRECECKQAISPCEVERARQYARIHGENHVCPAAIRKYKKARKAARQAEKKAEKKSKEAKKGAPKGPEKGPEKGQKKGATKDTGKDPSKK